MVENVEIERFYARLFRQNERVMKLGLAAIEAAFDYSAEEVFFNGKICTLPLLTAEEAEAGLPVARAELLPLR